MDKLSRRLHHIRAPTRLLVGAFSFPAQKVGNPVNNLSNINAAYIAGIVDGEGTITLIRKHKNENRQLSLSISSTELCLLNFIIAAVGAGKITKKRTAKIHHAQSYTFAIYNRQALSSIEQISPYLRTYKRQRAQLVIENYIRLTPRNGKYSEKIKREREQFEHELLSIKANV